MNVIKGLITKDILQLKSYKRTLIIFIAIFTITSIPIMISGIYWIRMPIKLHGRSMSPFQTGLS